jgi:oligopeptide/dipeptide ABC transporter ATP-binding protein
MVLVGPSGSGKTTALRMLAGLEEVDGGAIFIGDLDVSDLAPKKRDVAMVFQNYALYPYLTVEANIGFPLKIARVKKTERDSRVREVAELLGLTEYLVRKPAQLSGGQRQRVAIAASLVLHPELLVADEPVSMLDVSVRAGILGILDGLRDNGLAVLMITHDLSTAAHYADRIAVMYLGRIVEEGPTHEVIENPQHPYTRALLSVVPKRDPRDRGEPQILRGETPNSVRIPHGCRFHPRCPMAIPQCQTIDPELLRPAAARHPEHRAACIRV